MTPTQQQFISLLKCGLWGTHPTAAEFVSADWPAIVKMAKEQCVTALITDAMNELAAGMPVGAATTTSTTRATTAAEAPAGAAIPIDKTLLYKINFDAVRIAQRNAHLNATLAEITDLLNANGIPSVILKGQGVAQNYRKPEQRMSGDIDLYVGEANYKKAIDILQHSGNQAVLQNPAGTMQKSNETVKHYHMQYGDVQVELHKFANYLYNPIENRYFQRLTKKYLPEGREKSSFTISTTKIQTPPPQFDAVFLFSHLFHHFISGGIGLRQLCDWVRFLYVHKNEIDTTQLGTYLKKTGLLRAWKIFGYIAVDTLGLPTDFFPFYERLEEQGEKVLERIYQGGNFGYYSEDKKNRPRSYIFGKMYGFWRTNIWYIKLINMFPKDALIGQFIYWFSGVYHLFTDYKK
jgi:hypothetical protein